jgi:hypothetical protein
LLLLLLRRRLRGLLAVLHGHPKAANRAALHKHKHRQAHSPYSSNSSRSMAHLVIQAAMDMWGQAGTPLPLLLPLLPQRHLLQGCILESVAAALEAAVVVVVVVLPGSQQRRQRARMLISLTT